MKAKQVPNIARNVFLWFVIIFLAVMFSYAAYMKLYEYPKFIAQLSQSPYTTEWAGVISWIVPAIELLIVISLLRRETRLKALYASFALMLLFTTYIYSLLHYAYYVPCSCGGILEDLSWKQHLTFNSWVTVASAFAVLIYKGPINKVTSQPL